MGSVHSGSRTRPLMSEVKETSGGSIGGESTAGDRKEFKDKNAKLEHALADLFLNALIKGGFFGTALQVIEKCQEMKIFVDKWKFKATFMETQKNLRLPKLGKRKMKKLEFLDSFKNWAGFTT